MHLKISTLLFMAATAALTGAAFAGVLGSGSDKWLEVLGTIASGFVGAFGAYFGVRETIHAERQRDDDRIAREADRVMAALKAELGLRAVSVWLACNLTQRVVDGELNPSVLLDRDFDEPTVFTAMAAKLDLLPSDHAKWLIIVYQRQRELARYIEYLRGKELTADRKWRLKHMAGFLAGATAQALGHFGIELMWSDGQPLQEMLSAMGNAARMKMDSDGAAQPPNG